MTVQFSSPAEKILQVTSAITDNVNDLCEDCSLTANHITQGAFQCFVQNSHEVTFRARLHDTPTTTTTELINHIISWIETGASIAINGILLSVDQECDAVLGTFSEPECHNGQQITTQSADATAMTTPPAQSATTDTSQSTTAPYETTTPIETTTTTIGAGIQLQIQ